MVGIPCKSFFVLPQVVGIATKFWFHEAGTPGPVRAV